MQRTRALVLPNEVIETERLILKTRADEHAAEMFALIDQSRDHLRPWMPWEQGTKSVMDSLAYLQQAQRSWQGKKVFDYSVFERTTLKMIGSCGLHSIDFETRTAEIGYWIGKDYEGHGFMTEACVAIENMARALGFHRLLISCDRKNQRSQNIPKRLGYQLEAMMIDHSWDHHGQLRDGLRFVKLLNPTRNGEITENLPMDFSIKFCTKEEFWNMGVEEQMNRIFDDEGIVLSPRNLLKESEKELLRHLSEQFQNPYTYHALLLFNGELAGWMLGHQDSRDSFYMVNSAILPQHRGRGLYSRMLDIALSELKKMGFQRIWSRHNMTNNAILVPKLKKGFVMTGTELSDVFGALIHLTYFTNDLRRHAMDFRAGQARPSIQLQDALNLRDTKIVEKLKR